MIAGLEIGKAIEHNGSAVNQYIPANGLQWPVELDACFNRQHHYAKTVKEIAEEKSIE